MKEKELYEAPLVECYEIKLERRPLMASPELKRGSAGQDDTYNDIQGTGEGGLL